MRKSAILILMVMGLVVLLSACRVPLDIPPVQPADPSHTPTLLASSTPTLQPSPTYTPSPSPLPTATATPEPVTFKVGENDDMFSVALYFGVSLEALKTANPSVLPYAMGVGTVLQIPITPTPVQHTPGTPSSPAKTAEPEQAELESALQCDCYRDAVGGVYCFALIENAQDKAIENASAIITLTDENGKSESKVATTLLNVIPAKRNMPATTYFPPEWGAELSVQAELDFHLPFPEEDDRYLSVEISEADIQIAEDGRSAKVGGKLVFADKHKTFQTLHVLAVAYGEDGKVLGMRRWSNSELGRADSDLPFQMSVFSLEGQIANVELFVESMSK